jgi:hypothetical protein
MIVSYNASVVKLCNATSSLLRFENNNIFICLAESLSYYSAGVVVVIFKRPLTFSE